MSILGDSWTAVLPSVPLFASSCFLMFTKFMGLLSSFKTTAFSAYSYVSCFSSSAYLRL